MQKRLLALLASAVMIVTACGGAASPSPSGSAATPSGSTPPRRNADTEWAGGS